MNCKLVGTSSICSATLFGRVEVTPLALTQNESVEVDGVVVPNSCSAHEH